MMFVVYVCIYMYVCLYLYVCVFVSVCMCFFIYLRICFIKLVNIDMIECRI